MTQLDGDRRPTLITGGTGFIASYLAKDLIERGERVVLFDRNPDRRRVDGFNLKPADGQLTFVQGDLSLLPHVLEIFDHHPPRAVYHLGALLSAGAEANPTMGVLVDLVGTWHVLEAARLHLESGRAQAPITVLFPSTIASFGGFLPKDQQPPAGQVLNESVQVPQTFYGAAKVACERLGEQYHRKGWVDFRAVRFPSIIGASRGPGGTTVYSTLMIQEPAVGNSYNAYVPGDTQLDILYVKDAARALRELHDADGSKLKRRVYNINGIKRDDGRVPTAQEIANAVRKVVPKAAISFKNPDQTLTNTVKSFGILDGTAAQQEWGWKLHFDTLDKAVQDFIHEVKTYPQRLQRLDLFGA